MVEKSSGEPVAVKWEKMSKSKHNGIDPQVKDKHLKAPSFTKEQI